VTFSLPWRRPSPGWSCCRAAPYSGKTCPARPSRTRTIDRWLQKLEESAEKHGMIWLHAPHIAIGRIERGAVAYPLELLTQSMALKPNPIAARCIAVLQAAPPSGRLDLQATGLAGGADGLCE
jgi:hypothetical protein